MKKYQKLLIVIALFVAGISGAAFSDAAHQFSLYVRTQIVDYGTLRVDGVSTFNGMVKGSSSVAVIDSFVTTATADTVALVGAKAGDVIDISGYSPAYSSAIDTVTYAYKVNTDQIIIYRACRAGGAVKSGGQYALLCISKN